MKVMLKETTAKIKYMTQFKNKNMENISTRMQLVIVNGFRKLAGKEEMTSIGMSRSRK